MGGVNDGVGHITFLHCLPPKFPLQDMHDAEERKELGAGLLQVQAEGLLLGLQFLLRKNVLVLLGCLALDQTVQSAASLKI